MTTLLRRSSATFEAKLPELLSAKSGQFAVISGKEIGGTFPAFKEALSYAYRTYGSGNFIVKKIQAHEPIEVVACGLHVKCHA